MYPKIEMFIEGRWTGGSPGLCQEVVNPATGKGIGITPHASRKDLDRAIESSSDGFTKWRRTAAFDRYQLLRRTAEIVRSRASTIARIMTLEQGKPLAEAHGEIKLSADVIDWFAEEARRGYGRVVPARRSHVTQLVIKEPIGPVAAFTPWNFPINQAVRKISAALAAGCSIIVKGPEETPASCMELVRSFADAGVPAGVLNLVFGVPAEISSYLIAHPTIRKISFTGSTHVGKQLAALAGAHMKRVTMELGGHAPAIVFDDADVEVAVKVLSANKFLNAGQVCMAPTRFLIHDSVYEPFIERFLTSMKKLEVGSGLDEDTRMGPLANARRVEAMEALVQDAAGRGAQIRAGGKRIGNEGFFFEPTLLTDVPIDARIMNEEPFGPLVPVVRFRSDEEAFLEANRLPFGLAAYGFTRSSKRMLEFGANIESGMVSINHGGLALPELPFGGIKDSGYGSEGGMEAMEAYYNTKLITQAAL